MNPSGDFVYIGVIGNLLTVTGPPIVTIENKGGTSSPAALKQAKMVMDNSWLPALDLPVHVFGPLGHSDLSLN